MRHRNELPPHTPPVQAITSHHLINLSLRHHRTVPESHPPKSSNHPGKTPCSYQSKVVFYSSPLPGYHFGLPTTMELLSSFSPYALVRGSYAETNIIDHSISDRSKRTLPPATTVVTGTARQQGTAPKAQTMGPIDRRDQRGLDQTLRSPPSPGKPMH